MGRWTVFLETGPFGPGFTRAVSSIMNREERNENVHEKDTGGCVQRPELQDYLICTPVLHLPWVTTKPGGHRVGTSSRCKRGYPLE